MNDGDASLGAERTVLSGADISRALTRISFEILEANKGASDVVLLGIPSRGVPLARQIAQNIVKVHPEVGLSDIVGQLDVTMFRDDLQRQPTRAVQDTVIPEGGIDDKVVVLVDDVLYSGRTIRAALDALTEYGRPRAVRLAVLVDRGHRELPIRADHVGKNLPTSSSEVVKVRLSDIDGVDGEDRVVIAGGDPS
ncbi:bifunctional pyr operon transcriptional regulator/uracil phosphoribosyltransferase PyrR [Haematomicrobium sanguinis]|uniref:bifunctional pyr operon transcriptional regulator/uracil phosphoribosyltransferase PyrR n=1 Tax=Haematomicrobium sanguinis TaxID=479106 RepID=UPI00047A9F13|nr:bifunctional pyr operon transcriptional regulator/uracil phosphoribosyltransferase PyrR [Haematomicrobium sanguinis]